MTSSPETCTTREAAALLGISVRTAQMWVESGRLQAWKTPGGHRRIFRNCIDRMLLARLRQSSDERRQFEILIVEDDAVQRRLFEGALQKLAAQIQVRLANNGYEALLKIGERQPDVLVTDLMMPGLDGFAVLETLRANPIYRPMQIIVVTGMGSEKIEARGGLPAGVSLFHKPVALAQLVNLVAAYRQIWLHERGYE